MCCVCDTCVLVDVCGCLWEGPRLLAYRMAACACVILAVPTQTGVALAAVQGLNPICCDNQLVASQQLAPCCGVLWSAVVCCGVPWSAAQVVQVAAAWGTCYALADGGEVFAWGQGSNGQLGSSRCQSGSHTRPQACFGGCVMLGHISCQLPDCAPCRACCCAAILHPPTRHAYLCALSCSSFHPSAGSHHICCLQVAAPCNNRPLPSSCSCTTSGRSVPHTPAALPLPLMREESCTHGGQVGGAAMSRLWCGRPNLALRKHTASTFSCLPTLHMLLPRRVGACSSLLVLTTHAHTTYARATSQASGASCVMETPRSARWAAW